MKCCKELLSNPARRHFLICTGISTSMLLLDPLGRAVLSASSEQANYYLSKSEKFMADFEKTMGKANFYLKSRYGDQIANEICIKPVMNSIISSQICLISVVINIRALSGYCLPVTGLHFCGH